MKSSWIWKCLSLLIILVMQMSHVSAFPSERGNLKSQLIKIRRVLNLKDNTADKTKFYRKLGEEMRKRRRGKMLGTDIIDFAIEALGGEIEDEDVEVVKNPQTENEGILVGALDMLIHALGGEPEPVKQAPPENESSSPGIIGAVGTVIDDAIQNAQSFVENFQNDENNYSESNDGPESDEDTENNENSSSVDESPPVDVTGIASSLVNAINQAFSGSTTNTGNKDSTVQETEVTVIIRVITSLVETFQSDGTFGSEASSIIISTITAIHTVYETSSSEKDEAAVMIVQVLTSMHENLKDSDTSDVDVAQLMKVVAIKIEESYAAIEDGGSISASKLTTILMTTINTELGENTSVDKASLLAAVTESVNETSSGSDSSSSDSESSNDSSDSGSSDESSDSGASSESSDSESSNGDSESSNGESESSSGESESSNGDSETEDSSNASSTQSSTSVKVIKALSEKLQLYDNISSTTKAEILIKVNTVIERVFKMESEITSSKLVITLIEEIMEATNTELENVVAIDTNILIVAIVSSVAEVFMEEDSEAVSMSSLLLKIVSSVDEEVSVSSLNTGKLLTKIVSDISTLFSMSTLSEFTSGKVMISVVSSINEKVSSSSQEINVGNLIVIVFKEIENEFKSFSSLTEQAKQEGTMIFAVVKTMNEVFEESTEEEKSSLLVGEFHKDITKMIHDVYEMSSSGSVSSDDLLAAVMMVVNDSVDEDQVPSGDSSADAVIKVVTSVITDRLAAGGEGSGEDITVSLSTAVEESIEEKIGGVMEEGDSINSYGIASAILLAIENVIESSGETDITMLKFSISEIITKTETSIKSKIGVESVLTLVEAKIRSNLESSSASGEDVTETYTEAINTKVNSLFEQMTIVNAETISVKIIEIITEVTATLSSSEVMYDVDLIVAEISKTIESNLSNEGGLGEKLIMAAAAAIQNVQDGGDGEAGSITDEIAMTVIAAVNEAIESGMTSTEELIDSVVTAVLAISGIENEDFEEVIETVMETIEEILGIEEEENLVTDDQIEDDNLSESETSEITEILLVIMDAIAVALEEEDDGSGVDITEKLVISIERSLKKSSAEKLSVELTASSAVMVIKEILMEESEEETDITFSTDLIFESTEITIRKLFGVNDVVEVTAKVVKTMKEYLETVNSATGTDITEILKVSVVSAIEQSMSSSETESITALDISNSVVDALKITVESESATAASISLDQSIIIDETKATIVKYLGVDICVSEVSAAIEEIIMIGGQGAGDDVTEVLIVLVKKFINDYLGPATEDDNSIITAKRLAYLIRIYLIEIIAEIGSYEDLSYESEKVIRAAEVEIKEYFVVLSEDDSLDIMEVVDGAVSAICVMLGLCEPTPPPLPEPVCADDFIQYEDSCIFVSHSTTAPNWIEAEIACTEVHPRAHLASVHNQAELDFIRSNCSYIGTFFLGGTDAGTEGTWRWNNGRDWDFDNWGSGLPDDNGRGRENCLEMNAENGEWNDIDCGGFAGRCGSVGPDCRIRDSAPPKRYLCSYPLSTFKLSDFEKPVEIKNSDEDCGPWAGIWPQGNSATGEEQRPSAVAGITIVQAPNVPAVISPNPASNIPIELPTIIELPRQRKKNKGRKKTRGKKNKTRKNAGKRKRNRKKTKEGGKRKSV